MSKCVSLVATDPFISLAHMENEATNAINHHSGRHIRMDSFISTKNKHASTLEPVDDFA